MWHVLHWKHPTEIEASDEPALQRDGQTRKPRFQIKFFCTTLRNILKEMTEIDATDLHTVGKMVKMEVTLRMDYYPPQRALGEPCQWRSNQTATGWLLILRGGLITIVDHSGWASDKKTSGTNHLLKYIKTSNSVSLLFDVFWKNWIASKAARKSIFQAA